MLGSASGEERGALVSALWLAMETLRRLRNAAGKAVHMAYDGYRVALKPRINIADVILLADARLSEPMRRTLYGREYEQHELRILRQTLRPADRVLELGSGMGLLSIYCAQRLGSDAVTTFEGNPEMEAIIRANYAANGVTPTLIMEMVGPCRGQHEFHIRKNFWASSGHAARAEGSRAVMVPMRALDEEIARTRPSYLIVDIEGGEAGLFDTTELPGVERLLIEVHPDVIGEVGVESVLDRLRALRFRLDTSLSSERELFLTRVGR